VFGWFKRERKELPFTGAPAHVRMKTYSAMSGYAYQYVFAGQREVSGGIEYAFTVSSDRRTRQRIHVFVGDAPLAEWVGINGRELTGSERYGVAKMALRNAFDERTPGRLREPIAPTAAEVRSILEELDV
jgi:hypothetical protein